MCPSFSLTVGCPCWGTSYPLEEISTQNGPPKENNKVLIFINFGGRKEKTIFFVRIFDISPCVFTQISIGRARWMPKSNSASNKYPLGVILMGPAIPKTRNT